MLNIVTVNAGNYLVRGAEYVNTLFDMIGRNISPTIEKRFVCFTDDPSGLMNGIEPRALPADLQGWWNKLYLFSEAAFTPGERVLYFDLDTIITGSVDDLARFSGWFAICREFGEFGKYNSSVMAWQAGNSTGALWDCWDHAEHEFGDQGWISDCLTERDMRPAVWQNILPGQIESYKLGLFCGMPPRGTKVVAFHGNPKPHECSEEWIKGIWRVGGWAASDIETFCNTETDRLKDNIRGACARGLPFIEEQAAHDDVAVIVGGAPSLRRMIGAVLRHKLNGATIFGLNGAAEFMVAHAVDVDAMVLMDARPENVGFVETSVSRYLVATQADASVFDRLKSLSRDVALWHALIPNMRAELPEETSGRLLFSGGTTVLTRTMALLFGMGYRTFHIYGADSCYSGDQHHAYPQDLNAKDSPIEVIAGQRRFMAAPWMIAQVNEFQDIAALLANAGCSISVHGDGLLRWVATEMQRSAQAA